MLPGKIGNDENEWSDGMNDEANEDLPFLEDEVAPEEIALHIIDPMDDNPDAEAQHTQRSDAIPNDMNYAAADPTFDGQECAHPSCHCLVSQNDFCSGDCENVEALESQTCHCSHVGCENGQDELLGLQEIQGEI